MLSTAPLPASEADADPFARADYGGRQHGASSRSVPAIDTGMISEPGVWRRSARGRVLGLRIPRARPRREGP